MLARSMSVLSLFALVPGCATGWIATEASGSQRLLDEDVHEVHVPQPGVTERLTVTLQLAQPAYGATNANGQPATNAYGQPATNAYGQPATNAYGQPASNAGQPSANGQPATTANGQPATATPSVSCGVDQSATDLVYHQAFRYGSRWKKTAAVMFVLEAAAGAAFLLTANDKQPGGYVYGGFLGLDALVTAPLIFIPRKEIYRTDQVPVTTAVRSDCPDGLAIEIGSDSFPIDASGRLGDLGNAALAEWMKAPGGQLRIDIAGQQRELACTGATCTGTIPFAAGTLTSLSQGSVASQAP